MTESYFEKLKKVEKLTNEFFRGYFINPIWVIKAYATVIRYLLEDGRYIFRLRYPNFTSVLRQYYNTYNEPDQDDYEEPEQDDYDEPERDYYDETEQDNGNKNQEKQTSSSQKMEDIKKINNFWVGAKVTYSYRQKNYYGTVIAFVPAGELPPKMFWEEIYHRKGYVPKARKYDSAVVFDGKYRFPALNIHTDFVKK